MKLTRIAATGATLALIGGSIVFAGAAAATAADTGATYYSASDFGVEGDSYPAGWFVGESSDDNSLESGDAAFQVSLFATPWPRPLCS